MGAVRIVRYIEENYSPSNFIPSRMLIRVKLINLMSILKSEHGH